MMGQIESVPPPATRKRVRRGVIWPLIEPVPPQAVGQSRRSSTVYFPTLRPPKSNLTDEIRRLTRSEPERRRQFGVRLPTYFNAGASFTATRSTNPGSAPSVVPTLADGRVDRLYDDGFNRVNAAGNPALGPGGTPVTTFYGYQSDTQAANAAGAGTLSLHSLQLNGGDYHRKLNNRPLPGLEFYYRRNGRNGDNWSASLEFAGGYQNFRWREQGLSSATASLITDTFALNGVTLVAGTAPYAGPFTPVPGSPAIGSAPTRTIADVVAAVMGIREIVLHAFQFRIAPGIDWKSANSKWRFGAQAGLNVGFGFSDLNYDEQITVAGGPTVRQSGGSHDTHVWTGLFTVLRLEYQINESWSAHADLRHQLTGTLKHEGPDRSAEIDFSNGFGVAGGVGYQF